MTKKLLQINTVVNSGSTGRIAEEIGLTAMAVGWESYIAYGRNERPSKSKLIKIGNDWDIKIHGVQTRLFDKHGLASKRATNILIRKIKKIKPDIIHLHNIHGYYLNYEILFKYLSNAGVPIVWTLHDCWSITGHCAYFSFVGCEKWKTGCYNCPQKKEYPSSWLLDRSKENYELKKNLFSSVPDLTLVTVSKWLEQIVKKSYLRAYPTKVIHNGVDISVFKPTSGDKFREKHNLQNKFVLLGIANIWEPRKGFRDFIELSKLLDEEYQIVLVGLSSKQIKLLPNNIVGIKRTESMKELVEIFSTADIVLNLSYEETFGLTTVEGMACGTPVIVYNTTASPELIDSSTGIAIEPGNLNDLIKGINNIKKNGKSFYTDACVSRAHRLYRKEDRYKEYIELYEKLR